MSTDRDEAAYQQYLIECPECERPWGANGRCTKCGDTRMSRDEFLSNLRDSSVRHLLGRLIKHRRKSRTND